jgi:hypothetical protein
VSTILHLQRRLGNTTVQRLLDKQKQTSRHQTKGLAHALTSNQTTMAKGPTDQLQLDLLGDAWEGIKSGAKETWKGLEEAYRKAMLSGDHWNETADAIGFSYSKSLDDLADPFKTNATAFINALRAAGSRVDIETTRRSKERAWLMHHAWRVAHGKPPPRDDPYGSGIIWDHGSRRKTIAGARAMISRSGFNMAYDASLTSIHIRGLAIDMTITNVPQNWTFTHKGRAVTVRLGTPTTGQNRRLHRAARKYFKVKKLVRDRPHWSQTGH